MTIRQLQEERELDFLSPYASFSSRSRGRDREEEQCDIRSVYQRDRDRILHSKSFRRLKSKTQVFLFPMGDHYRTRLTHTLEVSQNARTIAKALRLNEDLVEAIALGHDLGHTPFGHSGEHALAKVCQNGFAHHEQSVRVVEKLENGGRGMNLTWEVRDGIRNHKTSGTPSTLEGKIVRLSDKIAYINHDIDDAIRAKVITEEDIPMEFREVLGFSSKARINTIIHDIVKNSLDKNDVVMSPEVDDAMSRLRRFMFERVYTNPDAKGEEEKVEGLVIALYEHFMEKPEEMPDEFLGFLQDGMERETVVKDYVAGMTDQYAITTYKEIFVPKQWVVY